LNGLNREGAKDAKKDLRTLRPGGSSGQHQGSKEDPLKPIDLTINGRKVRVRKGATVLEAIRKASVYVPTLCDDPLLSPYGACRLCIVEIEGLRGLPTSCTTPAEEGMAVHTETEEIQKIRKSIVEMTIADHPQDCLTCDKSGACLLLSVARYVGVEKDLIERVRRPVHRPMDTSHPAFDLDRNKCILCGKCVRVCNELVGLGAIDIAFRGAQARISPFGSKSMADSVCQSYRGTDGQACSPPGEGGRNHLPLLRGRLLHYPGNPGEEDREGEGGRQSPCQSRGALREGPLRSGVRGSP
jgi:ferredoxin